MFFQYGIDSNEKQTAEEESQWWASQLETYLAPYSERLDAYLDRRVVGNLTSHSGRYRANALGVDDERIGKCDLWARARGSRNATTATSVTPFRGGSRR